MLDRKPWTRAILLAILTGFSILTVGPVKSETAAEMAKRICNNYDLDEVCFPLRRAIKENPKDADLHYLMGSMYMDRCACRLRGQKELELCLQLDPKGPHAEACKRVLDAFKKELASKDKQYVWSNLDYWFDEYYRNHEYKSWDEDAQPDWVRKHDNEHEWKLDVHLISGDFKLPVIGASKNPLASRSTKWQSPFLTAFHDAWKSRALSAKVEGSADFYCTIDNDGVMHPIIFRFEGGDALRKILLDTCKSLESSPSLLEAGRNQGCFKARVACRYALNNSGTWCAFTSEHGAGTPVRVSLLTELVPGQPGTKGSTLLKSQKLEAMSDEKPAARKLLSKDEQKKQDHILLAAKEAIAKKDFPAAFELLWPLVEGNDATACFLVGKALASPDNIHPQPRIAELFFEKAVNLGNSDAVALLFDGVEFGNAQLSMQDAIKLCKKSADSGSAACQFNMGRLLEFGDCVEQDKILATHYYKLAAAANNEDAIRGLQRLSSLSRQGIETPQSVSVSKGTRKAKKPTNRSH